MNRSLGGGFIIHNDGQVVTDNHVVDRAIEITVQRDDGPKVPSKLCTNREF